MKKYLLLSLIMTLILGMTSCQAIDRWREERLGEAVVLEDGGVRFYHEGGSVTLSGIGEALVQEDTFESSGLVYLEGVQEDAYAGYLGDDYVVAGYGVALTIDGEVPSKPIELVLNRGPETKILGISQNQATLYDEVVEVYESGTFVVVKVLENQPPEEDGLAEEAGSESSEPEADIQVEAEAEEVTEQVLQEALIPEEDQVEPLEVDESLEEEKQDPVLDTDGDLEAVETEEDPWYLSYEGLALLRKGTVGYWRIHLMAGVQSYLWKGSWWKGLLIPKRPLV